MQTKQIPTGGFETNDRGGIIVPQRASIPENTIIPSYSEIHEQAIIGSGCQLGNEILLGGGVTIGDDVKLGSGCIIGPRSTTGVRLRTGEDCTFAEDVSVGAYSHIGHFAKLSAGCSIGKYSTYRYIEICAFATYENSVTDNRLLAIRTSTGSIMIEAGGFWGSRQSFLRLLSLRADNIKAAPHLRAMYTAWAKATADMYSEKELKEYREWAKTVETLLPRLMRLGNSA